MVDFTRLGFMIFFLGVQQFCSYTFALILYDVGGGWFLQIDCSYFHWLPLWERLNKAIRWIVTDWCLKKAYLLPLCKIPNSDRHAWICQWNYMGTTIPHSWTILCSHSPPPYSSELALKWTQVAAYPAGSKCLFLLFGASLKDIELLLSFWYIALGQASYSKNLG